MIKFSIKRIAFIAIFSAITTVLYCYLKFNLPIFPAWLDINFSMLPIIICAFMLGPIDASIVVVIRFILKLLLVGTATSYVGELADLLLGVITVFVCGSIYKYTNWKYKTLLSFVSVIFVWTIISIFVNMYINIPFFVKFFFKDNWDSLILACGDCFKLITFGKITEVNQSNFMFYYILLGIIPFNLLLSSIVVGITLPVHSRLKVMYDRI